MTPKEAALRKSPARYWPHSARNGQGGQRPAPDEVLRAKRLADERNTMSLTARLMGDPPPSRQQHLSTKVQG